MVLTCSLEFRRSALQKSYCTPRKLGTSSYAGFFQHEASRLGLVRVDEEAPKETTSVDFRCFQKEYRARKIVMAHGELPALNIERNI